MVVSRVMPATVAFVAALAMVVAACGRPTGGGGGPSDDDDSAPDDDDDDTVPDIPDNGCVADIQGAFSDGTEFAITCEDFQLDGTTFEFDPDDPPETQTATLVLSANELGGGRSTASSSCSSRGCAGPATTEWAGRSALK